MHQSLDPLRDNNNEGILTTPETLVNSVARFSRRITLIYVGVKSRSLVISTLPYTDRATRQESAYTPSTRSTVSRSVSSVAR